ncbi:hypothetical protein [Mesorhizobium sp. M0296]|uniref:hypothetical protein n=1 Tax=Mesorhizobium sp. M0296 TaxID=2956931 RepID=UPI003334F80A
MTMFPQTMIDTARAGGGLDIDLSKQVMFPQTMIDVAAAAAASGKKPTITFRNCKSVFPQTRIDVARAGQGCVVFVD